MTTPRESNEALIEQVVSYFRGETNKARARIAVTEALKAKDTSCARQVAAAREEEREHFRKILVELHNNKQSELHGGYDDADALGMYCFALQEAMQKLQILTPPTSNQETP